MQDHVVFPECREIDLDWLPCHTVSFEMLNFDCLLSAWVSWAQLMIILQLSFHLGVVLPQQNSHDQIKIL